jgi:hypothetical protein
MASELAAGVARVDITPPVGIGMIGYYAREGVSIGIERPLTATALVLAAGDAKIAIVACDLIFLQSPDVDRIRQNIAEAIGTDAGSVLMNFSHTHCGPTLPSWGLHASDLQRAMQDAYCSNLDRLLVGCAAMANWPLQPVRAGFGVGNVRIGINRREIDFGREDFSGRKSRWPDGS